MKNIFLNLVWADAVCTRLFSGWAGGTVGKKTNANITKFTKNIQRPMKENQPETRMRQFLGAQNGQ